MTTATNPNQIGLPTAEESPMSSSTVVASVSTNGDPRFRTQNPIPTSKRQTDRNLGVDRRRLDEDLGIDVSRGADDW